MDEERRPLDLVSPREWDVLELVAEGRSNSAIAESLYVSPNTVKTHVASLLRKLGANSRAHLAAIAARHEVSGRNQSASKRLQAVSG
jgi:two-component system, NarL family, response regulator DegU